jgi:aminoglycoside phosphotransferase (APT) family kinase protein
MSLTISTCNWVQSSLGPGFQISAILPQIGATSSTLHRIKTLHQGRTVSFILRRFTNREWLADEPGLAEHEASNLELASLSGLPVPELIAYDPSGEEAGDPAVLMTCLPGQVDLLPNDLDGWLQQQAEVLPLLHTLPAFDYTWSYFPYNDPQKLSIPTWSSAPDLWQRLIDLVRQPWPRLPQAFIHRDYHPVNVLFQEGRLSGIVDWPNACRGPAGIDAAWSRVNLVQLYGMEAADGFLRYYLAAAKSESGWHPFLDLLALLEVLPGPPSVYQPWVEYGVQGLTSELLCQRVDSHLASALAELG